MILSSFVPKSATQNLYLQLHISIDPSDISFCFFLQSPGWPQNPPIHLFRSWFLFFFTVMMCCWVSSVLTLEPPFFFTIILAYCTLEWIACCPGCIHKYGRQTRALHIYVRLGVSCSQSDPPIRKYIAFFFYIGLFVHKKENEPSLSWVLPPRRRPSIRHFPRGFESQKSSAPM